MVLSSHHRRRSHEGRDMHRSAGTAMQKRLLGVLTSPSSDASDERDESGTNDGNSSSTDDDDTTSTPSSSSSDNSTNSTATPIPLPNPTNITNGTIIPFPIIGNNTSSGNGTNATATNTTTVPTVNSTTSATNVTAPVSTTNTTATPLPTTTSNTTGTVASAPNTTVTTVTTAPATNASGTLTSGSHTDSNSGTSIGEIIGIVAASLAGVVILGWLISIPIRRMSAKKQNVDWLDFNPIRGNGRSPIDDDDDDDDDHPISSAEAVLGRGQSSSAAHGGSVVSQAHSHGHSAGVTGRTADDPSSMMVDAYGQPLHTYEMSQVPTLHHTLSYGDGAHGGYGVPYQYANLDGVVYDPNTGTWWGPNGENLTNTAGAFATTGAAGAGAGAGAGGLWSPHQQQQQQQQQSSLNPPTQAAYDTEGAYADYYGGGSHPGTPQLDPNAYVGPNTMPTRQSSHRTNATQASGSIGVGAGAGVAGTDRQRKASVATASSIVSPASAPPMYESDGHGAPTMITRSPEGGNQDRPLPPSRQDSLPPAQSDLEKIGSLRIANSQADDDEADVGGDNRGRD